LANEASDSAQDVNVVIVNSTNIGGSLESVQYSAIIINSGTELVSAVSLRLYSDGADIIGIHSPWLRPYFLDWNNKIGPFNLDPNQAIHLQFYAKPREPGSSPTIYAELISSDDEVAGNKLAEVVLHSLDRYRLSLEQHDVVAIEAEKFRSQSSSSNAFEADVAYQIPAWHLHSEEVQSTKQPDPDNSSPVDAGGGAYVEALPDARLHEYEAPVFGISNFEEGDGPRLNYQMHLDQPGRYYLFARMRATNSQDNTIHVSFDRQEFTPIEVCNPDGRWQWTSKNVSQCNSADSTYFEVESSGIYNLEVAMVDDGAELDRLVLRRGNSSNPSGIGPDPVVYQGLLSNLYITNIFTKGFYQVMPVDEPLTLHVEIGQDPTGADTFQNVFVTFDLDPAFLQSYTGFDFCGNVENELRCRLNEWPHDHFARPLSIDVAPLVVGELIVNARVQAENSLPTLENAYVTREFQIGPEGILIGAAVDKIESEGGGVLPFGLLALLSFLCLGLRAPLVRSPT